MNNQIDFSDLRFLDFVQFNPRDRKKKYTVYTDPQYPFVQFQVNIGGTRTFRYRRRIKGTKRFVDVTLGHHEDEGGLGCCDMIDLFALSSGWTKADAHSVKLIVRAFRAGRIG